MADIIDPLIPPYRFERVQPGLYRGSYPKPRNHRFLRRQRLKTIVSLIPGDNDNSLTAFCSAEQIDRIIINVQSPNENVTVTEETVSKCLELATSPDRAPVYIHCLDGSNVTGVIIMCLRKLQLWRVASYQNEYLRFEQDGEIIPEESEFVEKYSGKSLCLPNPYVDWLWPGRKNLGNESDDVNWLPFKGGMHPVVPLVRLYQRSPKPAAICFPDVLPALKRSATGPPAMLDSMDEDMPSRSDSTQTQDASKPSAMLKSLRILTGNATNGPDGIALITHERTDGTCAEGSSVYTEAAAAQRTEQTVNLHLSQSTGSLLSAGTEQGASSISKPSSTEHLPALLSGSDDPRVRRIIDPILAALAANPTAPLASLISPAAIAEVSNDDDVGHNRTPGDEAMAGASGSGRGTASMLADSSSSLAIDTMSAEPGVQGGESRENSTTIKEIALSRLVQALAIEGLGV
ncbi:protein-tyrosine-phosphatase [Coemansia sp. IMI 209127]|nr:protein-tyrosine-phosphatase [Coemansia sp. IMI 209127]